MSKVIIITGGTDGLGLAIARRLSLKNKVSILARNEQKLIDVGNELGCRGIVCDVGNSADCEAALAQVMAQEGRIDCLINNAGINISGLLEENDPTQIENTLRTNTLGAIFMTRAVLPVMKEQNSGLIININSQGGLMPGKSETSVYHASKWAVTGFTKSMQVELKGSGIRITGFYPGLMQTDIFTKSGTDKDISAGLVVDEVARVIEFVVDSDSLSIPELGVKKAEIFPGT